MLEWPIKDQCVSVKKKNILQEMKYASRAHTYGSHCCFLRLRTLVQEPVVEL